MFKKDKKNNPLTGLHGQELIDAIKNMNYVKVLSPEQQREFEISQAKRREKHKGERAYSSRLSTM